jgi:hypothetical protein
MYFHIIKNQFSTTAHFVYFVLSFFPHTLHSNLASKIIIGRTNRMTVSGNSTVPGKKSTLAECERSMYLYAQFKYFTST